MSTATPFFLLLLLFLLLFLLLLFPASFFTPQQLSCPCHGSEVNPVVIDNCKRTAKALVNLMRHNIHARDIMTRKVRQCLDQASVSLVKLLCVCFLLLLLLLLTLVLTLLRFPILTILPWHWHLH